MLGFMVNFGKIHVATGVICCVLGAFVGVGLLSRQVSVISPLALGSAPTPDSILSNVKGASTTDNYPPNEYFPISLTPKYTNDLSLSAKAYAVMDRDTGELLMANNIDEERSIASLTKIMTTLIVLENFPLEAKLKVGASAANAGEAFMGLTEGEILTVEDLLYGVMLPSGNDAAETLAQGLRPDDSSDSFDLATRRRDWFVRLMNEKAQSLGLKDTYFVNPTGLDERLEQLSTFSTALDLLALSNYALINDKFAEIAAAKQHIIPYKEGRHKAFYLYNILQFDRVFEGIKGIKPGVTEYAGETLASYIERDGRRIILILLESQATRDDAIKVYSFLFN